MQGKNNVNCNASEWTRAEIIDFSLSSQKMLCKAVHYTKQGELSVDAIRESFLFYRCFAGRVLFAMQGQPGGDTAQGRARPEISFIFFF